MTLNSSEISIIIADAQPVFRTGLRHLLSNYSEISISGEAGNSQELIPLLREHEPDILIFDYNPGFFNSDEITQCLLRQPKCKVVIISSQDKKWHIFKSLQLNVYCYLTKECGPAEIYRAIKSTARGEKFFCNFILDVLLENNLLNNHEKKEACSRQNLTERELEITRLIATGKKNKEIAMELNLSPHTVHTHRKNILKKVGVSSALELTTYALQMGILEK